MLFVYVCLGGPPRSTQEKQYDTQSALSQRPLLYIYIYIFLIRLFISYRISRKRLLEGFYYTRGADSIPLRFASPSSIDNLAIAYTTAPIL